MYFWGERKWLVYVRNAVAVYDGRLRRVEISTLGVGIRAKEGDGEGEGEKPRPLPRPFDLP